MIKKETFRSSRYWMLIPAAGAVLFLVLYVVAAQYYPGGSQADKVARGFDWVHNYWCNLLNERGVNGELSASRPIALMAMVVLCVTMGLFAWIFPTQVSFGRKVRVMMQVSGIAGMVLAMFIFTEAHDWLINISCLLGVISAVGTMAGLRMLGWVFWISVKLFLRAGNNHRNER